MKKLIVSYSNLGIAKKNNQNIFKTSLTNNNNPNKFSRNFNSPQLYNYSRSLHEINKFKINEDFIDLYRHRETNFGFNGLGELVYRRTYSRLKEDGTNEQWWETVKRVVEGTFNLLLSHFEQNSIKVDEETLEKIKIDSKIMYEKIFNFKFLPPGRGLWSMGTSITENKKIFAALNNCAFVSTRPTDKNNVEEIIKPYIFLMDNSMLGVGVGFDTRGSEVGIKIFNPKKITQQDDIENVGNIFYVKDSREGWVESVGILLKSYLQENMTLPIFDYSQVRPAGVPLKIFGGISSGPGPLKELHVNLTKTLDKNVGKQLDSRLIVDIMNLIGKSVVSGNISNIKKIYTLLGRTAEIAMGESDDLNFIELKNYEKNPERMDYGWVSNNSIYARLGMDYSKVVENIINNGEPGLVWLDNMRKYSRMCDKPDYRDRLAMGGNPCLEQTLESFELCCLAETFPFHHKDKQDYLDTLKYAFMYAKIVTLGKTHWAETNNVMSRNRRIGLSMTGIAQFLNKFGLNELKEWCEDGYSFLKSYDNYLSNYLQVPESIKITSIKPSGTVSLLGGATPGIHYPHSRFYIRRVRLGKNTNLAEELKKNGYPVEPDVLQPDTTLVASFPIDIGKGVKTLSNVSMWEQLSLASFMQKYWADNQVSCTVSFSKSKESSHIEPALNFFQYDLKGISFLPILDDQATAYPQMPYEEIDEAKYDNMMSQIKTIRICKNIKQTHTEKDGSNFCDSESCNL